MDGSETDGGRDAVFDFPNEGEIELDPAFVCEACGYANVRLTTANGKPAAKCTSCGQGYLETNDPFTTDTEVRTDGGVEARERFKYVLECPRYGCPTWVATTSEVTALKVPPSVYCPNHDDFVEMKAEPVKSEPPESLSDSG